jgi:hypothetical protein
LGRECGLMQAVADEGIALETRAGTRPTWIGVSGVRKDLSSKRKPSGAALRRAPNRAGSRGAPRAVPFGCGRLAVRKIWLRLRFGLGESVRRSTGPQSSGKFLRSPRVGGVTCRKITRRVGERTGLAGRRFEWSPLWGGNSAVALAIVESALAGAGERRECSVLVPLVRCLRSINLA